MAAGLDKGATVGAALALAWGSVFAEVSMLAMGGIGGACVLWALDDTDRPWWKVAGDATLGFFIAVITGSLAARLLYAMGFLQENGITQDLLWAPVALVIAAFWKTGFVWGGKLLNQWAASRVKRQRQ